MRVRYDEGSSVLYRVVTAAAVTFSRNTVRGKRSAGEMGESYRGGTAVNSA